MSNKVALVTGAGKGIGAGIAMTLARQGCDVVVADHHVDGGGAEVVEQIRKMGREAVSVVVDVSDEDSVRELVEEAVAQFGRLDIAINNAGIILETVPLIEADTAKFQRVLQVDVMGVFWGMKYQARQMLAQGGGAIVNVGSMTSIRGLAANSAYVTSKHAVAGLTKSAALDYAKDGIRINAVAAGTVMTDLTRARMGEHYSEDQVAALQPIGRTGTVQEIADAVAWLASDQASFCIGSIFAVDGGFAI
jgi:NAD(P)-dependent dehydrogenase (short-subunit alcohol dehydrogenase family)